jgi:hypothetical protein
MPEKDGLPFYSVERDTLTAQGAAAHPRLCPSCTKPGRWVGAVFVPDSDTAKGYPACACRRIHAEGGGAYGWDPETRAFLRRDTVGGGGG